MSSSLVLNCVKSAVTLISSFAFSEFASVPDCPRSVYYSSLLCHCYHSAHCVYTFPSLQSRHIYRATVTAMRTASTFVHCCLCGMHCSLFFASKVPLPPQCALFLFPCIAAVAACTDIHSCAAVTTVRTVSTPVHRCSRGMHC